MKQRDGNIVKAFKREISLKERVIPERKIYSRKTKHKKRDW